MPIFSAAIGGGGGISILSHHLFTTINDASSHSYYNNNNHSHYSSSVSALLNASLNFPNFCRSSFSSATATRPILSIPRVSVSGGNAITEEEDSTTDPEARLSDDDDDDDDSNASSEAFRQSRRSADWKAARAYNERGFIYEGRIEGFNGGGLLVRFYTLVGFLPFPQLSPSHSCKEPRKTIQEVAKDLTGSLISVKVLQADEGNRKLIFSEKEAVWSKFSQQINEGDIFDARVGAVEEYGAFVHLRFPDGRYHLTGLVHVSEVSWDLVQDVRDILSEGDDVRVKIIKIDRAKSRITLSIKQLEEDPLLETLDKVIPQDGSASSDSFDTKESYNIQPLPGLGTIIEELLREDGVSDVKITRQGFEKRVVSQDLQLWLSNAPPIGQQFTLLARAGRQVQEIQMRTSLDQEGIKKALQRVLERVP